jgi:ABC-2 type transport system permease protein
MAEVFRILLWLEIRSYLRNKLALFWTFVFPILLFAILNGAYGGSYSLGTLRLQVVDLDRSTQSEAFLAIASRALAVGHVFKVKIEHGEGTEPIEPAGLRLTIPQGYGQAIRENSSGTIDLGLGDDGAMGQKAAVGIILAANAQFNLTLTNSPALSKVVVSPPQAQGQQVGLDYSKYLAAGVVIMTIVSTCLMDFTTPIVSLREHGILKSYSILPLSKTIFMAAFLASRVVIVVGFTVLFLMAVKWVFHVDIPLSPMGACKTTFVVIASTWTFLALGLVVVGRVNSVAAAGAATSAIVFPLAYLSNLIIPFSNFPSWAKACLVYLPSSLAGASLRDGLYHSGGYEADLRSIFVLCLWGGTLSIATVSGFRWRTR